MSNLYKEALIESQNLKKLAEESAKKKILEEISPMLKKAITDQINESVGENFFVEDSTDVSEKQIDSEMPVTDTAGLSNTQVGGLSNPEPEPPLAPKGKEPGVMSATMPGSDGKITVDFEDLFLSGDPLAVSDSLSTVDKPEPVAPVPVDEQPIVEPELNNSNDISSYNEEPSTVTKESFDKSLFEITQKINEAFYLENLSVLGKEKIQQNLFNLLENLDFLKQNKIINENIALKNENKLEFLFLKLKEAKLTNSYIETDRRDINKMNSLKEYAAKLFEQDSTYSETADKKINHKSTASDEHAMKQSGVSPEIGGPADLKAATEKQNAKTPSEKPWDEGEPSLKEEVEVDEAELKEAIESLTCSPEKDKGWEKGKPVEKDPSHKNLKEDVGDDIASDSLGDMGESDEEVLKDVGEDEIDPDIILNIELPDEIEDALANIDLSSMGEIKVDVDSTNLGGESDEALPGASGDDDMELDFGDEAPSDETDMGIEPSEDDEEKSKDLDESTMKLKEAFTKLLKNHKILEAKLAQVEAENKVLKESVKNDRMALKEANLFLAKNVYFTKFLQRNDISKKNLKKIVEYLDRAETVNDAKSIYNKIKVKLTESAKASNKLVGSPSKVTTPGSVQTLNESVSYQAQDDNSDFIDSQRWAELAGIKKSK